MTRSKVLGKENEKAESFLYFAKALQFYLFCKSLTVLNDVLHLRWYGYRTGGLTRAQTQHIFATLQPVHYQNKIQLKERIKVTVLRCPICCVQREHRLTVLQPMWRMMFCVDESTKPIINNILVSRYVANMETFGFVPNESGRHQFHLKFNLFLDWRF